MKGPGENISGGVRISFQCQCRLGFTDFSFRQSVFFTNVQYISHMVADFRFSFLLHHIDFGYAVGIFFFRNVGDNTADKLGVRAFSRKTVLF